MFHPINRIECPGLEKLNEIAFHTTAFALSQQMAEPQDEARIRECFVEFLDDQGFPLAGEWLWGKPVAVRRPLLALLALPIAEKTAILEAYTTDREVEHCFNLGAFSQGEIPKTCDVALEIVKELLGNFYSRILADSGVPGKVLNEGSPLTRQSVLRAYLDANRKNIRVCPGCDGLPPSNDAFAQTIHEDVDHFFPKSRYPFLTIHPLNLTPLCKHCNQTYKQQRDAVLDEHEDVTDVQSLEHIYHPYLRPGRDEISVIIEEGSKLSSPIIGIRPKEDKEPHRARVKSLNYLLNLASRWTGELEEEEDCVQYVMFDLLRAATQDERMNGGLDDVQLGQKFDGAVCTAASSRGKISGRTAVYAFGQWLLDDVTRKTEWLRIAKEALV